MLELMPIAQGDDCTWHVDFPVDVGLTAVTKMAIMPKLGQISGGLVLDGVLDAPNESGEVLGASFSIVPTQSKLLTPQTHFVYVRCKVASGKVYTAEVRTLPVFVAPPDMTPEVP